MISELIKKSMKSSDTVMTVAYRSVKSKMLLVQKKGGNAPDEQKLFLESVKREIKEREESNGFITNKESDEYKKNTLIMNTLGKHLPQKLGKEEQRELIKDAIKKVGAKEPKDFGSVMKQLSGKKDALDMTFVSEYVRNALSEN